MLYRCKINLINKSLIWTQHKKFWLFKEITKFWNFGQNFQILKNKFIKILKLL